MGAKFLHRHVRTSDAGAVADALCDLARTRKITRAAEDEPCEHTIVVATDPASPQWTSIYGGFYDEVAWELSEKLATHVVVLSIFDGDVLEARLSNDGCEVDAFCTDPKSKGQPRRWDSLCVEGKSWRDVQKVFKSAAQNAEAALVELGKLIGLDERSLYPDHVDPAGPAVRRLRFKGPPQARRRILVGPPRVGTESERDVELRLSGGAQSIGWMVRSEGGGANGVAIAIGGAAVDARLIAIDAVEYRGEKGELIEREEGGRTVAVCELRGAGFPAASGVVHDGESDPEVADHRPAYALDVRVVPLRRGDGTLEVRFTPTDPAGEPGAQRWKVHVVE